MRSKTFKPVMAAMGLAASVLLLAGGAARAQTVALTAAPTQTLLPDGAKVPMWGYSCGAVSTTGTAPAPVCAAANPLAGANWSPVIITVPAGSLTIALTNSLSFAGGAETHAIPTSLVIVGQLGGGLGSGGTAVDSPTHAAQGTSWPGTRGGTDATAGDAVFTPPLQPKRVQSFGTEVAAGATTSLTWSNLKPGTYLLESGTHPSIQGPMGLYGVVVVTDPAATPSVAGYPGVAFDADAVIALSEIDPAQNTAVDTAVRTAGFQEMTVWSGIKGQCGDPLIHSCYPPAVNYDPRYYLINGVSFDRTAPASSTQSVLAAPAATSGRVLLRLVNAGLRMHVPAVVGSSLYLHAEDGNVLPGNARVQDEVFLAAGKTVDASIRPSQTVAGTYDAKTYPVYDRQLSLSTNNQRDGGMLAYVKVAGGSSGANAPAAPLVQANPDTYYVVGTTLSVSDVATGLMGNDVGIHGVAVSGTAPAGLVLNTDGTFTYSAAAALTGNVTFNYCGNGATTGPGCSTVTLSACTGACLAAAPVANAIQFLSNVAARYVSTPPGVLGGVSNPSGSALTASQGAAANGAVTLNADGSFVVNGAGTTCPTTLSPAAPVGATCVSFPYKATNSQGTSSAEATATVVMLSASGLTVNVKDAKNDQPITDYRWIIEEDRTFIIDPKCQINSTDPAVRPSTCPPLPVQSLGYNFHTANMPVVAQGCVGTISCESGQTLGGTPAVCDVGNGACRTTAAQKTPLLPGQVHLDPAKHYYISILPGDGVNPTIGGSTGPITDATAPGGVRQFDITKDCGDYVASDPRWVAGASTAMCGHSMGGAQIASATAPVNISLVETPLPTSKISVFVFEDDYPLNGENDAGGGVDILAPNEPGLGGFEIKIFDQAGGLGDNTGQITYDMFNMPVTNALAGTIDPLTTKDACPISSTSGDGPIGMIPTCPKFESDGVTLSPLAGQAVIANLYPGLYEIVATPGADRFGRGEEWLQSNTLDGGKPHEAFIKPNEPGYFQEFGPGGFHVTIGFTNPKIINDRRHNAQLTGICDPQPLGGGLNCSAKLLGKVTATRMARTPDQRVYSSGDNTAYGFTQCYVGLGPPDEADFAFAKCSPDGTFEIDNIPTGDFKLTVLDQWNDLMLDGLVSPVTVDNSNVVKEFPVTQWRTNLYTRTFIDLNKDGVSQEREPGLPLVNTNIRYRDGSYGFFNNTDLDGYAGFNEVFPFMNWLVVETYNNRYKFTGTHVVYDTGGPADGTPGGGTSVIADHIANTLETNSVPAYLRVPGAVYCANADCNGYSIATPGGSAPYPGLTGTLSSGRIDPPWATTEGWQGLLGQNSFMEFGMKPFLANENGGIKGNVIYASTRPFDDPALSLQLQWEPGVPRVKINLYQEAKAADGSTSLKLVDTTTSTSFDDWAQGFRSDGNPNMNCPGQSPDSPFFATLKDSVQYLNPTKAMPEHAQFKCYDGWSQLNQIQPAPYDGMYKFPSFTSIDPATGKPAGTNCSICTANPDDGLPMLPPGKYVVEVVVPPGYELVKEEDKNILLGDVYIAPVTQQFAGLGNIFILPDQAAVNAYYNPNSPGALNQTTNFGLPHHEGDTGSVEAFWPCVGAKRIVPDLNSLYPGAGQAAPFAGASRPLCDRKEVILEDQASVLAKFYVFSSTHIAGHFTGTITNDFASEFDPFSPQFGEKFGPPNLPVGLRDFQGKEVARVYSDQWGIYNGLNYSSYSVNPPNPTGYIPQMMIACMNDPGPIVNPANPTGPMIQDPSYNPAYSNFCYEQPFMPGFTTYMDTPVIPTQSFADGYNLPDSEYPDGTPAISKVVSSTTAGPWLAGTGAVASVAVSAGGFYTNVPAVGFTATNGGAGAAATSVMGVSSVTLGNRTNNRYSIGAPTLTIANPGCTPVVAGTACAAATAVANISGTGTTRRVGSITLTSPGSGYTAVPVITVTCPAATCTSSSSITATSAGLSVVGVNITAGGSGYVGTPTVAFAAGSSSSNTAKGTSTLAITAAGTLTITALGDKVVQNPAFSGPNATVAPYNQKTIIRHYGFGTPAGTVTIGGVNAPVTGWSDTSITVSVPSLPTSTCVLQQKGQAPAACGELEITAANGKKSIDTVTVTLGGKAPTLVPSSTLPTIQSALDAAAPGDLIIVAPGTYKEQLLMWKPVRLQGVGAASVTINADAHPAGKMDPWRRQVNCLFGLTLTGAPNLDNTAFDPATGYTCPSTMFLRSDRIAFEGFVGWDATSNGNLAQVLQEPTLMGAYEGAGITVLGRGVRIPTASVDFWGQVTGAGTFPDGSVYLTGGTADCTPDTVNKGRDYGTANFNCNPSRIDGLSIINSSQGGGGIFMHGWNHNLEIANNRVYANHGTLSGGINLGNGETPPQYTLDGTICGPGTVALCPPIPAGTPANRAIPLGLNTNVHVHHNAITNNASIGDALFSGTPSGSGGITISAGSDNYLVDHNWISGNLSSGDGAGLVHSGYSVNGKISHNWVLYNQSVNPTLPTNGGGIAVVGANADRTLPNGQECGTTSDVDCPPGIGEGTGPGLVIDANLIIGNSAESGSGGGLRLQQVNGTEVGTFPTTPSEWYDVTVTNNIIADNVAGWDGGGVSLQDALKVTFTNNTVVANDTTASAGVLFKTLGAINSSAPPPGCTPTPDPTQPQNPNCLIPNAPHNPQPAGLVTMANTPNLIESMPANLVCPTGYGYVAGNCKALSIPVLNNDLFWQNRAFHVEITTAANSPGNTGLTSQQSLVALIPLLNQAVTGDCAAVPAGTSPALYWDVGVRDDLSQLNHAGGAKLGLSYSLLTAGADVNGTGNLSLSATPVVAQFCNGSRVPPENGGKGYNAPAGRSETTGLSPVFTFDNITPAATVDEGHNWINLTFGPLTLFSTAGQALVAGPLTANTAAYSPGAGSPALNYITAALPTYASAPSTDFFGNARKTGGAAVDAGAVQHTGAITAPIVVATPSTLAFGGVKIGVTAALTVTLSNSGGATATGITVGGLAAPFSQAAANPGTCTATLAAGTSCTVIVTYSPTAVVTSTGSMTLAATGVTVGGSPITVSGTGLPNPSVIVAPTSLAFGNVVTGTTSATQTLTVANNGTAVLTGITVGNLPGRFTRAAGAAGGTCSATFAMPVNGTCTVILAFAPNAVRSFTGNLALTAAGAGIPAFAVSGAPVSLSGTGVQPVRGFSVSPTAAAFGTIAIGTTATIDMITINTGNVALAGGNIRLSQPAGPFRITTPAGATPCTGALAVGASCTWSLTYKPTAKITSNATVSVSFNQIQPATSITASGTGF